MNDLEYQESLAHMTEAELIDAITKLTEVYSEHLAILTHELLVRSMQRAE